ncbi:MAG TPA: hypothetical protein VF465_23170 [Flavobacterium sp.]|uniref:hypothetical protein n=1 Tax=Flavobacterium sp. TaxID=239 RepID=UPI002ED39D29
MKNQDSQDNAKILVEQLNGEITELGINSNPIFLTEMMDSEGPSHAHDYDHGGVGPDHGNEHGNQANEHGGDHGYGSDHHAYQNERVDVLEKIKLEYFQKNGKIPSPNDSFNDLLVQKKMI